MEKILGDPNFGSEIRVFAIFLRLHHYISLILNKIAAWDNVWHLVELKPPKIKKIVGQIFFILILSSIHSNLLVCITQGFLHCKLKILILLVLLLEWNKICCNVFLPVKIFVRFVKLLNISLDKYSIFLSCRRNFLMMIESEQKRLYKCSFQDDHILIILCDREYPVVQV